ncbi:regulatory component of sensory transduction system [Marinomonas sp. MED121]|uniref:GGDEF domain-containing protein n=1 Tax=Marinomonas sp. MED121 TaxID=314277 RepID=UPI000068FDA0|nr:diguanylate cyclase [Marinomonas sp. MED121]EAQ65523.1 regulatory component of sensory transduction system [Marinomonas sp. MED121]
MKLSKAAGTFDYPIRVAGCLLVMMNVYIARVPELDSTHLLIWIILLLFIIYPHIAFAKFVLNPTEKTEANSLLVDMFAIGLMANLVYFNPVIFLPYYIANSAAIYAMKGISLVFKGLLAAIIGALISIPIFGFEYRMDMNLYALIPSFLYLFLATHYVSYLSHLRGVILNKAKAKAEVQANSDSITKIANRRYFDRKLEEQWWRSYQSQQALSMLAIDIDFFKNYNDFYGHPLGDDCLNLVAQTIAGSVTRSSDLVARTGGEEFNIILPNTNLDGAYMVAKKVLAAIEALQIEHRGSDVSNVVTVSIGVSSIIPVASFSSRGLMLAADQALYQAKREGRNRISVKPLFKVDSSKAEI